jgi:hypothetical protein
VESYCYDLRVGYRVTDITCKQSVETFQINRLRYVMNLVLEYSSVTAVSLS